MGQHRSKIDSRFEKFGSVSFTAETKVNKFIDYLKKGKVMATHCKACKTVFFPPRADCCHCLESDMLWQPVIGQGKLVSYSQLMYAPAGFEADLPYTIALLDYGKYRVFGRLDKAINMDEVQIGIAMMIHPIELDEDRWSYMFGMVK